MSVENLRGAPSAPLGVPGNTRVSGKGVTAFGRPGRPWEPSPPLELEASCPTQPRPLRPLASVFSFLSTFRCCFSSFLQEFHCKNPRGWASGRLSFRPRPPPLAVALSMSFHFRVCVSSSVDSVTELTDPESPFQLRLWLKSREFSLDINTVPHLTEFSIWL